MTRASKGVASQGIGASTAADILLARNHGPTSAASWLPGTRTTSRPSPRRAATRPQYTPGYIHRLLRAALKQLDHIPQQHQALDILKRAEQRLERLGAPQHIALQARAEMEI